MYRIRMCLSYNGEDFFGWQKQPNQSPTIQGILENRLGLIFAQPIRVIGSGRTDRGTHALAQWAHADVPKDPRDFKLAYALNRMVPSSLKILKVELAPKEFHAQRSAIKKKYIYKIYNNELSHPFWAPYSHHIGYPLDLEKLNKTSQVLVGTHDFKSFQSTGTEVESTIRHIFKAYWLKKGDILTFHIVGSGFLKQMVRNIVGSILWAQLQDDPERAFAQILSAKDRRVAKAPVPALGLYLKWVKYPPELDIKCRKL